MRAAAAGARACSRRPRSPRRSPAAAKRSPDAAFCETLAALGEGRIDVGSDDPNELVGHVRSLEALLAKAPAAVAGDLRFVRDRLAAIRDAGGLLTLLDFAKLQDPELAGAQGRVTRFVADRCGVQ